MDCVRCRWPIIAVRLFSFQTPNQNTPQPIQDVDISYFCRGAQEEGSPRSYDLSKILEQLDKFDSVNKLPLALKRPTIHDWMRFGSFGGVSSGVGFFGVVGELKPGLVFGFFGLLPGVQRIDSHRGLPMTLAAIKVPGKICFYHTPKVVSDCELFSGKGWTAEEAFKTPW